MSEIDAFEPVLRAPSLRAQGFVHGFSTRAGGVSEGPFAAMNLGRSVGDEPASVAENHRRFAALLGYDPARLYEASQVHGCAVLSPEHHEPPAALRGREADAVIVRSAGAAAGVRTADCVPVLLADPETGVVAAVHAGWRGVVAGVVAEALRVLAPRDRSAVLAAIGPSIGPCCFEVGDEVAARLAGVAGDGIVLRRGRARPHVDLWRGVEHQLRALDVRTIDTLGACTVCDADRFFSYRRDGQRSGRMLAVIAAR